jgi:sulfite oxidase
MVDPPSLDSRREVSVRDEGTDREWCQEATMTLTRRNFVRTAGWVGASLLSGHAGCAGPGPGPSSDAPNDLIIHQETPLNAEPRLDHLVESSVTPAKYFYVRSHGTRPAVDPGSYRLSIEGMVERPLRLTLEDLEKQSGVSVPATLQCAGNRRLEHSRVKPVGGVQWDAGAIGTAEWTGIRLADLVRQAGPKPGAKHLWFEGLDSVTLKDRQTPFGGGIPLEKAMSSETLLALQMNGRPLSREHGFPARTIVPGFIGARSVKWLGRIVVSERSSDNNFLARDYKMFPPEATPESVKPEQYGPIYEMVLGSAICSPQAGEKVPAGTVRVRGYAVPPGEAAQGVSRVEVSPDDGKSWIEARLVGTRTGFTWVLWEADVPLSKGPATLVARATDSKGRTQPEKAAWNFKGYLNDSWHRVAVTVS